MYIYIYVCVCMCVCKRLYIYIYIMYVLGNFFNFHEAKANSGTGGFKFYSPVSHVSLSGDHGHHGGIHALRDNGAPVSPMTPQNPWDSKKVTLAVPSVP